MGPVVSVSFLASREAIGFWSLLEWWINDKQFHELELNWCESKKLIGLYACQESFFSCPVRDTGCFAQRQVRAAQWPALLSQWEQDQWWQHLTCPQVSTPQLQQCFSRSPQKQEKHWANRPSKQICPHFCQVTACSNLWGAPTIWGRARRALFLKVIRCRRMKTCW